MSVLSNIVHNTSQLKTGNQAAILSLLRRMDGMSRVALTKALGMTKGGITPLIQELLALGMICETERVDTRSGRKPILMKTRNDCCCAISLDWSRSHLFSALVDFGGNIQERRELFFHAPFPTQKEVIDSALSMIETLRSLAPAPVIGVGISVPGPIDYESGSLLVPPNFNGWGNIPLRQFVEEQTGLPVFVENNARAHTLAERDFGYGKQYQSFLQLVVDEGIGGGIVQDGRLLQGMAGGAGEIGHITVNIDGESCPCGNNGCLELYASVPQMLKNAEQMKRQGLFPDDLLPTADTGMNWSTFVGLAQTGNRLAEAVVKKEADFIGCGIASAVNLLEPQAVVIGSLLAELGDMILQPVCLYLQKHTMYRREIPVLASQLKDPALLGTSADIFSRFIDGTLGSYRAVLTNHKLQDREN